MINDAYVALGKEPSAIRKLYAYGLERKAVVGPERVYDLSIGNPSVPAPQAVADCLHDLASASPIEVHGYTMAQGLTSARQAIADNLNRRFGIEAAAENFYLTAGATAALTISIAAISNPGDEFVVNAPHFPEYKVMIESARCTYVPVMMRPNDFQMDIDALARAITPRTAGVIMNSPNNPVGCIYSEENVRALADLLEERQRAYAHPIYLISDEPYREISYGKEVPFTANYYNNTIVCYSWAKSLSLPGERIGYVFVPNRADDAAEVMSAVAGAGRALGYICAPALFQRVIEACVDEPTNVEAYRENRRLLTAGLGALGYEFVEPDGAFYLWVRALEDDAQAFSDKARAHDLLVVPSDSFGCPGWVRCSYCVSPETISGSMHAWKALKEEYAAN